MALTDESNGIGATMLVGPTGYAGNNCGFGGGFGGDWAWIILLLLLGWGNNGNGTGFLANQLNNDAGRDLLLQAINGRADALSQLAQITNTSVETVKNGIFSLQNSINQVDNAKDKNLNLLYFTLATSKTFFKH